MKIRKVIHFHSITSTNIVLKEKALQSEPEGTVLLADEQTQGIGRFNKKWESPKNKGLYFSILLRPAIHPSHSPFLSLIPSIAVVRVLHSLYRLPARVKWPNDILVHGKKVCGILCESSATADLVQFFIIGIGVNLHQDVKDFSKNIANTAASLSMLSDKKITSEDLFYHILKEIDRLYEKISKPNWTSRIRDEWMKYCDHFNQEIKITKMATEIKGYFAGIDSDGNPILAKDVF